MARRKDLDAMYRHPGNVTSPDLAKAAEERRWAYTGTEGSHAVYRKAGRHLSIPVNVKGIGTIPRIIQTLREDN